MSTRRRLIPLLVAVLVIQGLVGAVPHTHGVGDGGSSQTERVLAPHEVMEATHDCLACSVHAPVVESATDRGLIYPVETTSPSTDDRRPICALSPDRTAGPRAPPWFV